MDDTCNTNVYVYGTLTDECTCDAYGDFYCPICGERVKDEVKGELPSLWGFVGSGWDKRPWEIEMEAAFNINRSSPDNPHLCTVPEVWCNWFSEHNLKEHGSNLHNKQLMRVLVREFPKFVSLNFEYDYVIRKLVYSDKYGDESDYYRAYKLQNIMSRNEQFNKSKDNKG